MFKHKFALIVFAAVFGTTLFAAPWFTHSARRRPETLLVTGNYNSPYVLAETYHGLTNQPYLRVMQDGKIYLVMPKKIHGIAPRELAGVINALGLKRIVIIGDERYVSADFEKALRKANIKATPIVRIYGENWLRVAEELDDLLNVGHLSSNFRENLHDATIRTNPTQLQRRPRPQKPETTPATPAEPVEVKAEAAPAVEAPAEVPAAPADNK